MDRAFPPTQVEQKGALARQLVEMTPLSVAILDQLAKEMALFAGALQIPVKKELPLPDEEGAVSPSLHVEVRAQSPGMLRLRVQLLGFCQETEDCVGKREPLLARLVDIADY